MRIISLIVSILVYLSISIQSSLTEYESLSIALFTYWILSFLNDIGKKLVVLDIIILSGIFSYLIMPIIGYHHFDRDNSLAFLWKRFMWVPTETYFGFMFPAVFALILGLKLPLFFRDKVYKDHTLYMQAVFSYVGKMKWEGLILVVIGVIASLFQGIISSSFGHIFFLLSYLLFIGVFYCLYSDFPMKKIVLWAAFSLLIVRSLMLGMFGELIFMAIMATILLALGKKLTFWGKLSAFVLGIVFILVIQVVKPEYRSRVWASSGGEGAGASLFMELVVEKFNDPSALFKNEVVWFNFYSRFNQGLYVGLVLRSVPARFPYANGETINESLAGAIVPRVLWPEKQKAGGVQNFKRFLGIDLRGYSVGISPFGEAWGNYGKNGGIVFMFLFGLLFNFIFAWILKIAVHTPSLILWLPLMFFYAVKIETDVFSMVNSLFKACMFTFIMYKVYPLFFRGRL